MGAFRKTISTDECKKFNQLRDEKKYQSLSKKDILSLLKERVGWSVNDTWFSLLIQGAAAPIKQIDKGKYAFSKEPVLITKLQSILKEKQDKMAKYNKATRRNAKEKSVVTPQKTTDENTELLAQIKSNIEISEEEQKAINLLKGKGYIIFKPETKYKKL